MRTDLDWLGEAALILDSPVRAKKGKKGLTARRKKPLDGSAVLATVSRLVARKPEVMVKVSGSARGKKHLREHLNYVTRNGELEGEREDGSLVLGRDAVKDMAADWWAERDANERRNTRDTINIVLSMPAGTDREAVAKAARSFAHAEFGGKHDFLLVHHTDTEHPHAHLSVRALGYDGQRLDPRKGDLQAWREGFAQHLRVQGVDAEATPRTARGKVQKGTKQAIKHLDKRQASRVTRWRIEQAIKTVARGEGAPTANPAREKQEARLAKTKRAWQVLAKALDEQGAVDLAVRVRVFAEGIRTQAVTQQDVLVTEVKARMAKLEQERGRKK